ncbi:MAG TPA: Ig-like domain-containing protein, partial [Candidatus Limnocylindria bacterium]|nr:Ig-like domain-containing protein [Candidatus Limnocylindria bacterium]
MIKKLARTTALLTMVLYASIAPLRASADLAGSLIVAVTSPASGSTITGTVPVNASVSIVGTLTVAGVQFKRDGVNIGTEDNSTPYSVSWNTTTATNGSHNLTAVARDSLGGTWTSNPVTVTVANDTTPPTVSINQAAAQVDPTGASPITFTAVFSEAVSGFSASDVIIGGTAGGGKTTTVGGGPSTYSVAVSGMTTSGTVTASIAAGAAQDAAGNASTASTSTDNSVSFDATRPT